MQYKTPQSAFRDSNGKKRPTPSLQDGYRQKALDRKQIHPSMFENNANTGSPNVITPGTAKSDYFPAEANIKPISEDDLINIKPRSRASIGDDILFETPHKPIDSCRAIVSNVESISGTGDSGVRRSLSALRSSFCTPARIRDPRRRTLQTYPRCIIDEDRMIARTFNTPSRASLDSYRSLYRYERPVRSSMDHANGRKGPYPLQSPGASIGRRRNTTNSHSRQESCPTLDITRIMRSISVSNHSQKSNSPHETLKRRKAPYSPSPFRNTHPLLYSPCNGTAIRHSAPSSLGTGLIHDTLDNASDTTGRCAARLNTTTIWGSPISFSTDSLNSVGSPKVSMADSGVVTARQILYSDRNSSSDDGDSSNSKTTSEGHQECLDWLFCSVCGEGTAATECDNKNVFDTWSSNSDEAGPEPLPMNAALGSFPLSPYVSQPPETILCSEGHAHKKASTNADAITNAINGWDTGLNIDTISDSGASATRASEETMTITLKGSRKRGLKDDNVGGVDGNDGDNDVGGSSWSNKEHIHENARSSQSDSLGDGSFSIGSDAEDANPHIPARYLDTPTPLWDQYIAELSSADANPNIHLKRKRVLQFLRVPWNVECLLWFGVAICFDSLLYVFTILPVRFVRSVAVLLAALIYELPSFLQLIAGVHLIKLTVSWLPEMWQQRLKRVGDGVLCISKRLAIYVSGNNTDISDDAQNNTEQNRQAQWLTSVQLFDLCRGFLVIVTCFMLCRIDAAQLYHSVRAQSSLKLYFIYSALDIFDRLLSSFGHDALDALQSATTDPVHRRWRTGLGYYVVAQCYMLMHTLVLFCQVITLNVAVNAYSDQLLSLLISNQFVEIKSNVFKKWEKEMLFQVTCADIVERFQEIIFLFIIILRNFIELSGTGFSAFFAPSISAPLPGIGINQSASSTGHVIAPLDSHAPSTTNVQAPVSFDKAVPSAFGPLLPSWVSVPVANRILTPILMVLGSEILIDWIKHAFITKLNWIRPEVYSHYIDILCRDLSRSNNGQEPHSLFAQNIRMHNPASEPLSSADPRSSSDSISQSQRTDDSHDDQNVAAEEEEASVDTRNTNRPRSSSALVHIAGKGLVWCRNQLLREGTPLTRGRSKSSVATLGRQPQDTKKVPAWPTAATHPQLFVEQSSRVARRLGLSPMPLACLILLMLMQVFHILGSSSHSHSNTLQAQAPLEETGEGVLIWISTVPIIGNMLHVVAIAVQMIVNVISLKSLLTLKHMLCNPSSIISLFVTAQHMESQNPIVWNVLDGAVWAGMCLLIYILVLWTKLLLANRLAVFSWARYRSFMTRIQSQSADEKKPDPKDLKQYDDPTKKLDFDQFIEVKKLLDKDKSEADWEKQRPKWTIDNIERYSLFKSRIP